MMVKMINLCTKAIAALAVMGILASCGTGAAQPTATATTPPTDTPTPSPTPIPRSATIKSVEGTVDVRVGAGSDYAPATAGQTLSAGDSLRTGADGRALIVLDDGTGVVVSADSSLDLSALEGTHESPVTQFFLNVGAVFTLGHGELAPDASYEIDTPKGQATIRGSMLGVAYSEETGTQVTCLIGHCGAELDGQQIDLTGGKKVTITDTGLSELVEMDAAEKLEWSKAIKTAEENGVQTSDSISPTCACSGADMTCSDGTSIPSFPTCVQGAACTCTADGALTCGDQTAADSPICDQNAANCTCAGPNMICDGGQTFYNVAACTGGDVCLCQGADLVCADGATYPGDPSCAPKTGCSCNEGILYCPDGTVSFNTPECTNPDIPCTCDGTTLVCTYPDQNISIPDYPLCGGGTGTGGGGGENQCVCADGTLYCSDGSVTPGGC